MVVVMAPTKRIRISDLNSSITCPLCKGYLIDATTITECLHSFCRSCLVKYLVNNKFCPVCDVQVHKTKPLVNIRADKTLQDFVYKLVPGLYQNEMLRRRTFYETNKHVDKPSDPERMGVINKYSKFISADERLSISLEFLTEDNRNGPDSRLSRIASEPPKSFLSCPAIVVIRLLKKWLLTKFDLDPNLFQIEMFYDQHLLYDDLTLMDVAYLYVWQGNSPMNLTFKIYERLPKLVTKEDEDFVDNKPPPLLNKLIDNDVSIKVEIDNDVNDNTDIQSEEPKLVLDTPTKEHDSNIVTDSSSKSDSLPKIPDLIDIKTRKKTNDDSLLPITDKPIAVPPTVSVATPTTVSVVPTITTSVVTSKSEVPSTEPMKISSSVKVTSPTTIPVLSIPSPPLTTTSPIKITPKPVTLKATATVAPIRPRDELIIVPISKPSSSDTPISDTTSVTTSSVTTTKTTDSASVEIRRHRLPQSVQHNQHTVGSKRPMTILGKMADSQIPPHKNLKLNSNSSSGGTRPAILSRKVPIYNSVKNAQKSMSNQSMTGRNHRSPFSIASLTSSSTSDLRPTVSISATPVQHQPFHYPPLPPPLKPPGTTSPPNFEYHKFFELNRKQQSTYYDNLKITTQTRTASVTTITPTLTHITKPLALPPPPTPTKTDHRPYISSPQSIRPLVTTTITTTTTTIATSITSPKKSTNDEQDKTQVEVTSAPSVTITTSSTITTPTTISESTTVKKVEEQDKSVPTTTTTTTTTTMMTSSDTVTVPKSD